MDHDGTVLLADFGVGGDINDPATMAERAIPAAEELSFDRKPNGLSTSMKVDLRNQSRKVEDIGRRKSFVGTVRSRLYTLMDHSDRIVAELDGP